MRGNVSIFATNILMSALQYSTANLYARTGSEVTGAIKALNFSKDSGEKKFD